MPLDLFKLITNFSLKLTLVFYKNSNNLLNKFIKLWLIKNITVHLNPKVYFFSDKVRVTTVISYCEVQRKDLITLCVIYWIMIQIY